MHYLMDLDNTLLDTYHIDENGKTHFHWSEDFEKDFNLPLSVLDDLFQGAFLISLQRSRNLTRFIDPFLKKYQIKMSADEFLEYWLSRDMRIKEDVWQWILNKKEEGHSFHIASNQPFIRMDYLWSHLPSWHEVFECVFTSSNLGVAKPDESFFIYAKNIVKTPFQNMCLIDDSPENIKSAQSLGMETILFQGIDSLK
ncbi:MAG: HAD hydrolase-like protein [Alphaproteobacteria bacterium]|nr:HAD hydrolase-like protein [Alphaproteobacteria bacterium]